MLSRRCAGVAALCTVVLVVAVALFVLHSADALAQGPFGVGTPSGTAGAAAAQSDGIVAWIIAKQAEFYRAMAGTIRSARTDGSALWFLFGIAFLYGVFHAAGPGHGKAVISSYMVANEEAWTRGVVLSFASALLQAVVAVIIVGVAAVLLNATARQMCDAEWVIALISYALIALLGARLLWVKGRGFLSAVQGLRRKPAPVGAAVASPHHDHSRDHDHHHHGGHHHHDHGHGCQHHHHDHDHDHASAWGHAHGPEPQELVGPGGWRRGLTAIVAVGLRPCSGAILVLVFALAQGLFWAGIVATFMMAIGTAMTVAAIATLAVFAKSLAVRLASSQSGYGMLAMRGIEVGAAMLVLAFGLLLLLGYMSVERAACF